MKSKILEIKGISKSFKNIEILNIKRLDIYQGEKIALIGPSGAGKSTLLNIISNTIEADKGSVFIDDVLLKEISLNRTLYEKVGIIRQHFDLVDQLSVINNVLAGNLGRWGTIKSLTSIIFPRESKEVRGALRKVGLTHKTYEKTSNLSGGEKQRVALARLLIQNPKIILADEPVASLDPARAEDILKNLILLAEEKQQTLITSLHSIAYAKKYYDRIIALKNGKVFFDMETKDITKTDFNKLYSLEEGKDHEKI